MRVQPREPEVIEEVRGPSKVWGVLLLAAGLAFLALRAGVGYAAVAVGIIFFIFMHELGHYLTAKWAGMKVTEFFIGFGPRLWSFRRGETEYGVKAIPAGAYVRIIGMSNLEDDVEPSDEERTYRSKPYWRRLSVAVAGSTMHFLMALVLIYGILVGFGDQAEDRWRVASLSDPSGALEAGVQLGDRIVAIDGQRVETFEEMSEIVRELPGETVTLDVVRDGEALTLEATLGDENPSTGQKGVGFLGIGREYPYERVDPVTAIGRSVTESIDFGKEAIGGLAHIFSPSGVRGYVDTLANPDADGSGGADVTEDRPSSIIGVVQIGGQVAERGLVNVFWLMFAFNIFIGIFNLVPLLPFDGGHVAIATYEKIRSMLSGRRYQADVAKLLPLTYAVVLVMALLFVTTIYLDIAHPVDVN